MLSHLSGKAEDIDSGYRETVINPHLPEAPPGYVRAGIPSVVITSDGTAHILCPHRDGVRYFRSTHTSTTFEDINTQRPHMLECYLGVRPSGELIAAYGQSGGVKYARNDGTGWLTQTVPTTGYHGTQLSGAILPDGEIALLVTERITGIERRLSLYRHPGEATGSWSRTTISSTIESDGNFAAAHEMVSDSAGNLHIVYQTGWSMEPDIGANYIRVSVDGTLSEETLAGQNNFGDFDLILDDQDEPHVLHLAYNSYINHASRSEGAWTTTELTVPPGNLVRQQGGALGLLRDSSGKIIPAILRNGISHVRWAGTEFTYTPISQNTETYGGKLVTVDPDGFPVYLWVSDMNGGISPSVPVTIGIVRNTRSVEPTFAITKTDTSFSLSAENLMSGESYMLSRSESLDSWEPDDPFIASGSTWSHEEQKNPSGRGFFTMQWLHSGSHNALPME